MTYVEVTKKLVTKLSFEHIIKKDFPCCLLEENLAMRLIFTFSVLILLIATGCVSANERTLSNVPDDKDYLAPVCSRTPRFYSDYPEYALEALGRGGSYWKYICNTDFSIAYKKNVFADKRQDVAHNAPDPLKV